ncbi:MAG: hypothetical protein GXC73_20210 [Chitinophagaceae bacterium]|nr:hypothetical protein [Chitinophagaceae bacterium]
MLFNTIEISKELHRKLGEEVIRSASPQAAGGEVVFIDPLYQLRVFNFLFYEPDFRFDQLHDLMLLFEPGKHVNSYLLQYQLSSRCYTNKLLLAIPFEPGNHALYSVKHLYGTMAARFEQHMHDIHNITFNDRSTPAKLIRERVKNMLALFPFSV